MKRIGLLVLTFILIAGARSLGPTVPNPISQLASDKFQPRTKGAVVFRHQRHEAAGISCTTCHHDYDSGRNTWRQGQPVPKCEVCHQILPRAGRLDLKNAFHRQCKGCHLTLRKTGRAAGPIKCQDCHRPT